eukprot:s10_g7.t1
MALAAEGFSHALVVTDASTTPLHIVNLVQMDRVCRGRRCTLRRGSPGATWDQPIDVGENLCLAIPSPGERSHDDLLTSPRAVAQVQTAPALPLSAGPSMRLEDQSSFVRALHELWRQQGRPAQLEHVLTVTTWYLDGVYVPFNDGHRVTTIGADFTEWENELRAVWVDLQDASQDIDFVIVHPTPACSTPSEVHILLMQQIQPDTSGVLVTSFDNSLRYSQPFTAASFVRASFTRPDLIDAVGRAIDCFNRHTRVQCTTWHEGREISDFEPFHSHHGQSFNLIIYHPALQEWENPLPDDESDDHVDLLQRSLSKVVRLTAAGEFSVPLPDYVEVPILAEENAIRQELQCWGHDCHVILLKHRDQAFCFPHTWNPQPDLWHVFFENEDFTDSQGCFAHTMSHSPTELDLMILLYSLGYEKAVIVHTEWTRPGIWIVRFCNAVGTLAAKPSKLRINKPWPLPQPQITPSPVFVPVPDSHPACLLNLGVTQNDLCKFFSSTTDVLATTLEGVSIPEVSAESVARLSDHTHYDRLIIYVDGTSQPSQKHKPPLWIDLQGVPDAWAFIVLGEPYNSTGQSQLSLVGWQAQQVRYDIDSPHFAGATHAGSLVAERETMLFAALWRLSLNSDIPTVFRSDSQLTCDQATGLIGTATVDTSFALLRGLFQALSASMPPEHLLVDHVYGHNADPWNELTDAIAKHEAQSSHFLKRQPVDLRVWTQAIPFLWLLFGHRFGGPQFCGHGFDVCAPALPKLDVLPDSIAPEASVMSKVWYGLSFASANVATLSTGENGFAGKLAYIKSQFVHFKLNFLGVQEARTAAGTICNDQVLRFCSGAHGSCLGVELWCNTAQPFVWTDGKSHCLSSHHFQVLHADPRRLLVRVAAPHLQFLLLVGHAPHSGTSLADRQEWWTHTDQLVRENNQQEPMFFMLDANAGPGPCDGVVVIDESGPTGSGTPFFLDFLHAHKMCLPCTRSDHVGERKTWTTPDGQADFLIDFVAVPQDLLASCTWSQTLDEFDLATSGFDHTAVGLELQWWGSVFVRSPPKCRTLPAFARDNIRHADLSPAFDVHPVSSWCTDVEQHVNDLNAFLHDQLFLQCAPRRKAPKKPFISDDLWTVRQAKLYHRRQLKYVQTLLRRESLARIFAAWKSPNHAVLAASYNFGCTLRSGGLKHAAGFVLAAKKLKRQLQSAKRQILADKFAQFDETTSASEVLHSLKSFVGSSNALKRGLRPLPFVLDVDDKPCKTPDQALQRWISFFMQMEGGFKADDSAQKVRWIRNLERLQVDQADIPVAEIPSLTDLEVSMRRIKPGKATGPDFLPAELFHFHAAAVARQSYALFLKTAVQAHEPLLHKGGLGVHQVRAFQRIQASRGHPTACIFLDLAEAFYRVVRPLAISGDVSDEMLAHVAKRLNLDATALGELHALLSEPSAIQTAGVPEHACRAVKGLHQDTHFALHGQTDHCVTTIGSRPGDAWADIVFGFLFAKVLHGLQAEMQAHDILEQFPTNHHPHLFGSVDTADLQFGFVGPCWCDDLCVCVSGTSMDALVHRTGVATGILLDLCKKYGMLPNLSHGKTEIMFSARGKGSRKFKPQFLGPTASKTLPIIGDSGVSQIHLVGQYKHLGCVLHHAGDLKLEVKIRLAIAHQTFTRHRKLLFQNPAIPLPKRTQLFQCLIGSRLLYGAESWVLTDQRTKDFVHASIMRLYRRLLKAAHDDHLSDDEILHALQLPSPSELLRVARLRYLGSLFACPQSASWGLLNQDHQWIRLVEDDLEWMYSQLHHSSDLLPPAENLAQWFHLITWHRPYWKRLIQRACKHAILQRSRCFRLLSFHKDVFGFLHQCGQQTPAAAAPSVEPLGFFGCMLCQISCKSKGGEGAHMNRCHGYVNPVRKLFAGTQCAVCLREYFTSGKLKQHLLHSRHVAVSGWAYKARLCTVMVLVPELNELKQLHMTDASLLCKP